MLKVAGVQVRHFLLAYVVNLTDIDLAYFFLVRHTRSLGDASSLLQERGGWRAFSLKVKGAVAVDRDDDWDRRTVLFLGAIV